MNPADSSRTKKHVNIPIFVPHMGCPHDCVFCDQRAISGRVSFDIKAVDNEIKTALATIDTDICRAEIAFFGGSFTGIDKGDMTALLATAAEYVRRGEVSSVRISTRPDLIDCEILNILRHYHVQTIELGVQSMSDRVLSASRRGHTAADSRAACAAVKAAGFNLVGQMMLGLPLSSPEDELSTAQQLCRLGADAARIYPTAVLSSTSLWEMTKQGRYIPLTRDEAVERAAGALEVFVAHGVPVIRIGLCETAGLYENIRAGVYHSAFGELAESAFYYKRIKNALDALGADHYYGKHITIHCPIGAVSKIAGHKKLNKLKIQNEYNVKSVKIIENSDILEYNIIIT